MSRPDPTLENVVHAMVRIAAGEVLDTEDAALADAPDGVHRHRTRVRRLRSILSLVRDHVDPVASERLRREFREWGRQLGTVRDAEVAAAEAEAALAEAGIDDDALRRRMVDAPTAEYTSLHAALVRLRQQPRAEARMRDLRAFAAAPTRAPGAGDPGDATSALGDLLRREVRRVKRAAKRRDGSMDDLHDLRKAGRRLRYAAEAVAQAGPARLTDQAVALGKAGSHLHDVLGEHRDAVALADRLERTKGRAARAGEPTAPYDVLVARATERASTRLDGLDRALARLRSAASDLD